MPEGKEVIAAEIAAAKDIHTFGGEKSSLCCISKEIWLGQVWRVRSGLHLRIRLFYAGADINNQVRLTGTGTITWYHSSYGA